MKLKYFIFKYYINSIQRKILSNNTKRSSSFEQIVSMEDYNIGVQ